MNRYNSYVNILNRYILVCLKEELINNILFIYLFILGFFFIRTSIFNRIWVKQIEIRTTANS